MSDTTDSEFRLPGLPPAELPAPEPAAAVNGSSDDIPDFTVRAWPKTIKFKIDGELFEALPALGAVIVNQVLDEDMELQLAIASIEQVIDQDGRVVTTADNQKELDELGQKVKAQARRVIQFLDEVLVEESRARFAERLRSKTNPIEMPQVWQAYRYLIERYSNRPSTPSSSSTNGHGTTGTSSTAGAPPAE